MNELERSEHINISLFSEKNFAHYMSVAETLSKSTLVPKNMIGKPSDILIAMEMGNNLGIPYMQALQDIAVINGRPSLYGDALLSVVQGHKDYEWIKEDSTEESATCTIKRRNHEPHTSVFTKADAQKAQLWGRPGPWTQYAQRMLQMRARGFCIRDVFADALRGVKAAEEVQDYQIIDVKSKKTSAEESLRELLTYSQKQENDNTCSLSSVEQHDLIEELITETQFSSSRITAALKHYGVNAIYELEFVQAEDFINKLKGQKKESK